MKFFHLSDLHIGLKLINHDLSEDQKYVFDQIIEYAKKEKPDAVLIAGDIYDKSVPSAEAVLLFDDFISSLSAAAGDCEIMMISGNHDSAARVNQFRSILCRQHIHMIGIPPQNENEHIEKVVLSDEYGEINFYLLPFVKPSMVKLITGTDDNGNNLSYNDAVHFLIERENIDTSKRNVLVSHQLYLPAGKTADEIERMDSEIRTVGNIDEIKSTALENFDYAALGHIHKPMKVGNEKWRYCGTPLACSVSEEGQTKGIIMVEAGEKGSINTSVLELKPCREVRTITGTLSEVLKQSCGDYVTAIITDKNDIDVIDMQDRLRLAFPNLLEIRRDVRKQADYSIKYTDDKELDEFELCKSFLGEITEEETSLLEDVINTVKEAF